MPKTWYQIKAQGEDGAEIDIFDEIGYWGIRAQDFIRDLRGLGSIKNIKVRINSPGGDVFDGVAIHNALKRHEAFVTVEVYGIAASIASIIAMAGNKVIMPENTWMFIHDPLAIVVGDADDMRDMADALEKIAAGLISSYVSKTGKDEKEVKKWMSEDTWFTAAEALEAGLADEVSGSVKLAASANLERFKNLPKALAATSGNPPSSPFDKGGETDPPLEKGGTGGFEIVDATPEVIRAEAAEIIALCNDAEVPGMAAEFLKKGARLSDVQKRFANVADIKARCVAAGMKERIAKFIEADMTPEEVSAAIVKIQQALDPGEINNQIDPGKERSTDAAPKPWDSRAIYKRYEAKR